MKWLVAMASLVVLPHPVSGQSRAKEVADFVIRQFGKNAVKEGAASFAARIDRLATQHGHDVYHAVAKVGPNAIHLVEHSGTHAKTAAQVLARHGDEGIVLVARPQALALIARHGDDAAIALLEHKGIAEPIIERFGGPGVHALAKLDAQNGRRLAMLLEEGAISRSGKAVELLDIIGKYGDRAMAFVWEHKGALAITAVLAAFIARPEVFISGAEDIARIAGENVARPIAETPGKVAVEVAKGTNWTMVFVGVTVVAMASAVLVRSRKCSRK